MSNAPEKQLWAAVLLQAVEDYAYFRSTRYNAKDRMVAHESAKYWLFRSKEDGPGSLIWICDALEIDIDFIRNGARELRAGQLPKRIKIN